jgi:hypothetical protein
VILCGVVVYIGDVPNFHVVDDPVNADERRIDDFPMVPASGCFIDDYSLGLSTVADGVDGLSTVCRRSPDVTSRFVCCSWSGCYFAPM